MQTLIDYIKHFLQGFRKDGEHERPKTFWRYFIYYPINFTWTLGSILFIGIALYLKQKYEAPIFYFISLIPFLLLVYNLLDEYEAFQWYMTGSRSITAKRMMFTFYGLCGLIMAALMGILILNEMKLI